jgi:hypothetical protein
MSYIIQPSLLANEESAAIHSNHRMDCFVATLRAMTKQVGIINVI